MKISELNNSFLVFLTYWWYHFRSMSVNFSSIIVFALGLLKCTFTQFCHFFFRNKYKSHIYRYIILKFWRLLFHWWNMIPWKAHHDARKTLDSIRKNEVQVYFEQGCRKSLSPVPFNIMDVTFTNSVGFHHLNFKK